MDSGEFWDYNIADLSLDVKAMVNTIQAKTNLKQVQSQDMAIQAGSIDQGISA